MILHKGNGCWTQEQTGSNEERKVQSHNIEKVPVQGIVRTVAP